MMKREDIVGVYRQLGEEVVDAAGKVIHSDNNRSSQIMYSRRRLCRRGEHAEPGGRRRPAPAAAPISAARRRRSWPRRRARSTCYAGHYELKDGEVHHHIEMALNPNLIGQTLIRRVHIDGAEPHAVGAAGRAGQRAADLWRRVAGK